MMLAAGGPVMAVLGLLSVAVLAAVLWKAWQFWHLGLWWTPVRGDAGLPVDALVAEVLQEAMAGDDGRLQDRLERAGDRHLYHLQSGLRLLETAAVLAPLLGLLGTVLGMIEAFRALEAAGQASPAALAGGIWEALLTTAFGMAIAIVAAGALALFDGTIDRARHRLSQAAVSAGADAP